MIKLVFPSLKPRFHFFPASFLDFDLGVEASEAVLQAGYPIWVSNTDFDHQKDEIAFSYLGVAISILLDSWPNDAWNRLQMT